MTVEVAIACRRCPKVTSVRGDRREVPLCACGSPMLAINATTIARGLARRKALAS